MATRSTIYEVARRSGVSIATVSRVMHAGTGFSAATGERVLGVAAELGWLPSGQARGLAFRRSGIVGVLFPDVGGSGGAEEESPLYMDEVIRGAERAATSAGDAVLIAATRGDAGRELAYSVAGKVDGLVVMARSLATHDIEAISRSVPIVVFANHSARQKHDSVGADNRGGAEQIVTHLVQAHGYRDIVFIAGPARSPDSMERFAGYRQALAAADMQVPKTPAAEGAFTEAGGARAVRRLLAAGSPPRAMVFGNDEMAIGALGVLREAKLRVPGDVAITGFDDIASARHVRPTLTTVRQPMRDLGEHAVRVLLERLRTPGAVRQSVVLPTKPVIRRSCGCDVRAAVKRSDGS
ncbi:MAG: LacI family transcriptional regulator [Actinomycetota bacterium]|nr:LacI family transcriptional regulator [Actinomycetota bacterium]